MSSVELLPLKGIRSIRAYNAYHKILTMLFNMPAYAYLKDFNEFMEEFHKLEDGKRSMLKEGLSIVELTDDEHLNLLAFCKDANGISVNHTNHLNYSHAVLLEMELEVLVEISNTKVFF